MSKRVGCASGELVTNRARVDFPMSDATVSKPVVMDGGQMLCLRNGAGILIALCQGCGVLTQEDDWDDVVLKNGSTFALQNHGKAILMGRNQTGLRLTLVIPSPSEARIEIKRYISHCPVLITTVNMPRRGAVAAGSFQYFTRMLRIAYQLHQQRGPQSDVMR